MNTRLCTLLLTSLLFGACRGEVHVPPTGGGEEAAGGAAPMDDHGTPHPLGNVDVGTIAMTVTQFGDVEPGHEVAFDVVPADDAELPGTVYAWIGVETGVGSRKGKLDLFKGKLHGHADAPDPIPEGSRLWLEMNLDSGPVRGSIALHR